MDRMKASKNGIRLKLDLYPHEAFMHMSLASLQNDPFALLNLSFPNSNSWSNVGSQLLFYLSQNVLE